VCCVFEIWVCKRVKQRDERVVNMVQVITKAARPRRLLQLEQQCVGNVYMTAHIAFRDHHISPAIATRGKHHEVKVFGEPEAEGQLVFTAIRYSILACS